MHNERPILANMITTFHGYFLGKISPRRQASPPCPVVPHRSFRPKCHEAGKWFLQRPVAMKSNWPDFVSRASIHILQNKIKTYSLQKLTKTSKDRQQPWCSQTLPCTRMCCEAICSLVGRISGCSILTESSEKSGQWQKPKSLHLRDGGIGESLTVPFGGCAPPRRCGLPFAPAHVFWKERNSRRASGLQNHGDMGGSENLVYHQFIAISIFDRKSDDILINPLDFVFFLLFSLSYKPIQ